MSIGGQGKGSGLITDVGTNIPSTTSRFGRMLRPTVIAGVGLLGVLLLVGKERRDFEAQTQKEWDWLKDNWGPRTRANASKTHERFEKEWGVSTDIPKKFHRDNIKIVEEAANNADPGILEAIDIPITEHFQSGNMPPKRQSQHHAYNAYQTQLLEAASDKIAPLKDPSKRDYRNETIRNMKPFLTRMLVWQGKLQKRKSSFRRRRKPIHRLKGMPSKEIKDQMHDVARRARVRANKIEKGVMSEWAQEHREFGEYIAELFIEQKGKCAVTGIDFEFDKQWMRPSMDRLDNRVGYYPQNIRLTLQCINHLLNVFPDQVALDIKADNLTAKNMVTFRMPAYTIDSSHWDKELREFTNDGLIQVPEEVMTLAVKYKNQLDIYQQPPYNFVVVP